MRRLIAKLFSRGGANRGAKSAPVLTIGVVGLTAIAVALVSGAFGTFTDTETAQTPVSSGTVIITLPAAGATNRMSVAATNIAAGDTIQRALNITNGGTLDWSSITMDTVASTSSLLNTDATNGLQLDVDECSVAWTEAGPPYTYTCSGTTTNRVASTAVIGTGRTIGGTALTSGATGFYRFRLTLPSATGNTFQNLSSVIDYTLTATQRAATNK